MLLGAQELLSQAEKQLGATKDQPIPEFILFRINLFEGTGRNKELREMREILAGIDVDTKTKADPDGGEER